MLEQEADIYTTTGVPKENWQTGAFSTLTGLIGDRIFWAFNVEQSEKNFGVTFEIEEAERILECFERDIAIFRSIFGGREDAS